MKPSNLKIININPVKINDFFINKLEVDLQHINYGLGPDKEYNQNQRSSFTAEDIEKSFLALNHKLIPSHLNSETGYYYYVFEGNLLGGHSLYKIIFCIHKDSDDTSGIITFFKLRGAT